VTERPYAIALTRTARRALTETLPVDVAMGAADFFADALATSPYRVGKALDAPLGGIRSARLMREWRVLYTVDDDEHLVVVRAILHRRDAYRPR
jgi:mRNA interferase RelE/StbE